MASTTAPWDSGCCALLHMKDREVAALIMHKTPCVTNGHLQVNLFSVQKSMCHSLSIWFRTSTDSVWICVYDLRNRYQLFTIVYSFFLQELLISLVLFNLLNKGNSKVSECLWWLISRSVSHSGPPEKECQGNYTSIPKLPEPHTVYAASSTINTQECDEEWYSHHLT